MQSLAESLIANIACDGEAVAFADPERSLTRRQFFAAAMSLAVRLGPSPRTVGIFLPNGVAWAVAVVAAALAGKTVVPLPTFFSPGQIAHVVADAGIGLVLTDGTTGAGADVPELAVDIDCRTPSALPRQPGFGVVVYTSGSTGAPKGVRLGGRQIAWSAEALARASGATAADSYLSLLPLPLLLEMIAAVFVPIFVGGRTFFDRDTAEAIGRGQVRSLAPLFERHRPTTSVLLPELLRIWCAELAASGRTAPSSLRFVAAGGAPVPPAAADTAWRLGIPVHEGYGLSECCSVVALNRPGERKRGTVGRPLDGLKVGIDDGEIVVAGPSVTDGYLGAPDHAGLWRTGDLGRFDEAGNLVVIGRKDNLIVTGYGRNVSPEWVEAALVADPRLALACVAATGDGALAALVLPAPSAEGGFAAAGDGAVAALVDDLVAGLPAYARPERILVMTLAEARGAGLLTDNGRIRRPAVAAAIAARGARAA